MSRLTEVFRLGRREGRGTLVGYLPAGFPSYAGAVAAMRAMVDAGVDLVEVGLPYSDPLMDGPVIEAAVDVALKAGTRTRDVLAAVEQVAATGAPVLVMTYWNPIDRYGVDRFAADLASAGGSGLITPDLIPDEAGDWLAASDAHDLERVFLVAPSSTDERLRSTAAACRGWVYAASTMGVTGVRSQVGERAQGLVVQVHRAGLSVGRGLPFQHQHPQPAPGEQQRRRQPHRPGADDDHGDSRHGGTLAARGRRGSGNVAPAFPPV